MTAEKLHNKLLIWHSISQEQSSGFVFSCVLLSLFLVKIIESHGTRATTGLPQCQWTNPEEGG